jgi:hypothetical protein
MTVIFLFLTFYFVYWKIFFYFYFEQKITNGLSNLEWSFKFTNGHFSHTFLKIIIEVSNE